MFDGLDAEGRCNTGFPRTRAADQDRVIVSCPQLFDGAIDRCCCSLGAKFEATRLFDRCSPFRRFNFRPVRFRNFARVVIDELLWQAAMTRLVLAEKRAQG